MCKETVEERTGQERMEGEEKDGKANGRGRKNMLNWEGGGLLEGKGQG